MKRVVLMPSLVIGLTLMLGLAAPANAGERAGDEEWSDRLDDAGEALKEQVDSLMRMLEGLVAAIPQYSAAEILDNGDIIIRRKQADEAPQNESEEDGLVETSAPRESLSRTVFLIS